MTRISPATFARLEARVKELEQMEKEFREGLLVVAAEVGQIRKSIDRSNSVRDEEKGASTPPPKGGLGNADRTDP